MRYFNMEDYGMKFRAFDFALKGEYIGFCIVLHKDDYTVSIKKLSGTKKQLEEEFYYYRKTLDSDNDITLEFAIIKNYGTVSKDYIQTRVNRFIEQTKANNFEIRY